MRVTFEQLKAATLGAVRVQQDEQGIHFYRFTEAQEALYSRTAAKASAYVRSITTAGVRLHFRTNSCSLGLAVTVTQGTSRSYFSFDVLVNGKRIGTLDNIGDTVLQGAPQQELPIGSFEGAFDLGAGEKEVCIHFPWSVVAVLKTLTLDDGATVTPVKPDKKILVLGDSITQGYDARYASHRYAAQICDRLGAEEVNKAIGGECFFPPLAATPDDFTPALIWVAYGTNDWSNDTEATIRTACRAFYEALCTSYPGVTIVALTPIWRGDHAEAKDCAFLDVQRLIHEETAHLPQVTVIDGYDLVPKDSAYFADLRLHPNDDGFAAYVENFYHALSEVGYDRV